MVTGFIPYTPYQTIRIKSAEWIDATTKYTGHYYLSFYNVSKTLISDGYTTAEGLSEVSSHVSAVYNEATGVTTFEFIDQSATTGFTYRIKDAKYFRINVYGKGADLIITVNQEIT